MLVIIITSCDDTKKQRYKTAIFTLEQVLENSVTSLLWNNHPLVAKGLCIFTVVKVKGKKMDRGFG